MAKDRLTKTANIGATARELDFVTRFARNFQTLRDIMGITAPIKKVPGAVLKSKIGAVTLQTSPSEGDEIPYSQASVIETPYAEMTVEKYAKAVSIEAIKDNGYDVAVALTDDAFLAELQNKIIGKFFTYANTGALTAVHDTFQMALAMAKGYVVDKFKRMNREVTDVVGFCNVLDFYAYLGAASITVQTAFGYEYVTNFMGYKTLFLVSSNEVARNRVIAVPVENIRQYYVDPSDSDFARAGLEYTTDAETGMIGFHTQGNYGTAVSEAFAILGVELFAEYIDGIAVVTIDSGSSAKTVTAATEAGTTTVGDTVVTISAGMIPGGKLYWKAQASTSPTAPDYKAAFDATGWTAFKSGDTIASTNGHKYTIVEVNGVGQVYATATGTVTAKAS